MQDSLEEEGDSKLKEGRQWGQNELQRMGTFGEEDPLNRFPGNPTIMHRKLEDR